MKKMIYMDHAATTPVHPQVIEVMLPYLTEHFGNASSIHAYGRAAKEALNDARESLASYLGCPPRQLIFTSGGTESDNAALFGLAQLQLDKPNGKRHIITSQIEHHAVLHACHQLEKRGFQVTYLAPNSSGMIQVDDVIQAIQPDTFLISIMYGNNEVGTIQPIQQIGELARSRDIYFHTDAVQALSHIPFRLADLPVDFASFSAHKINGPKGIGALYIAPKAHLQPMLFGGVQERGRRAGTENVPGAVGFALALQLAMEQFEERNEHLRALRKFMIDELSIHLQPSDYVINGSLQPNDALPHILNISFPSVDSETMLMNLDLEGIAAASGSACTSGSIEPSHVLKAMQLSPQRLRSAIRFSFGYENCFKDVTFAVKIIETIMKRIS